MNEAYENAICPCGSGKRYIDCCLPRHIEKSRESPLQKSIEEFKKAITGKDFPSLEETNRFIRDFNERRNSEPKPDFMGLSSDQVHRLIDLSFSHTSDMVQFKNDFKTEDMSGIPVVTQANRFLGDLAGAEPLKATAQGNLPPHFAKPIFVEFDQSPLKNFIKFRTEMNSMTVHFLRLILSLGGWIKKEKGYFRLTRKGIKAVEQGFTAADYLDLFVAFVQKFNWGYQDGYPAFEIIQRATLFSLFLLHKKARGFIESYSLSPYIIRAFPLILAEAEPRWDDVYSQIDRCYTLRFLERFCLYFGLIELRERNPDPLERTMIFKTSPFFDRFITWKY